MVAITSVQYLPADFRTSAICYGSVLGSKRKNSLQLLTNSCFNDFDDTNAEDILCPDGVAHIISTTVCETLSILIRYLCGTTVQNSMCYTFRTSDTMWTKIYSGTKKNNPRKERRKSYNIRVTTLFIAVILKHMPISFASTSRSSTSDSMHRHKYVSSLQPTSPNSSPWTFNRVSYRKKDFDSSSHSSNEKGSIRSKRATRTENGCGKLYTTDINNFRSDLITGYRRNRSVSSGFSRQQDDDSSEAAETLAPSAFESNLREIHAENAALTGMCDFDDDQLDRSNDEEDHRNVPQEFSDSGKLLEVPCSIFLRAKDELRSTLQYKSPITTGTKLNTYIDTGASHTVISYSAAKKAGIAHLIDPRYSGHASGVAGVSCRVLGRIPANTVSFLFQIGNGNVVAVDQSPALIVLEERIHEPDKEEIVDLLLGLDVLEEWQATICFRSRSLHIHQLKNSGGHREDTEPVVIPFVNNRITCHADSNRASYSGTLTAHGRNGGGGHDHDMHSVTSALPRLLSRSPGKGLHQSHDESSLDNRNSVGDSPKNILKRTDPRFDDHDDEFTDCDYDDNEDVDCDMSGV